MSSGGLELLTIKIQQMTIESTNDKQPTTPAITYSECYRLPFLSLFHADCMDIMKQYPDKHFDLAIVDPPYGIGASEMTMGSGKNKKWNKGKQWDNKTPEAIYWNELKRISKNQIVWGGNYFELPITRGWIFWDKGIDGDCSFADGELAWTSFDKVLRKAQIRYKGFLGMDKDERIHPTQKPIALYDWIIKNYLEPNQKILDTHFGSGSIALAVDKANRLDKMNLHLTAVEIDREYIDKAIKRISESIKQGTLSF